MGEGYLSQCATGTYLDKAFVVLAVFFSYLSISSLYRVRVLSFVFQSYKAFDHKEGQCLRVRLLGGKDCGMLVAR